ncbi:Neurotensin Receptor Type 2 [Manis pentadactyla]|nr:Neurotensin Receptor Type 2 [Manis pentadactyla]
MDTGSPQSPRPGSGPALSLGARLGVETRLWAKVLVTTLYALTFVLGSEGNALSVHVVLKARAGPPGRLRYHVLSLALSALLLLLVSVPMGLYNLVWFHDPWVFCDLGCRAYFFVRELCAYATVLSVASLSAERCLAVCQPLHSRRLPSPRRTRRLLSLVNVLVPFVLPLALTAFLNGVMVSHLVALCSQVPATSAPGSPAHTCVELMSEERKMPSL